MTEFFSPHKHAGGTPTRTVGSNTERPWAVVILSNSRDGHYAKVAPSLIVREIARQAA